MEEIMDIAARLAGTSKDDTLLTQLCGAAYDALLTRLKDGVTVEDCGKAFAIAVAAIGCKAWNEGVGDVGISTFAAGSVSLSVAQEGDRFTSAALALLTPWLKDSLFGFLGV